MMNEYKYESKSCFLFLMPYNQILKVVRLSKFEIDEDDDDNYRALSEKGEIEGVIYVVRWNDQELPWHTKSHLQATIIAMGCQWAAHQMFNMRYPNEWKLP